MRGVMMTQPVVTGGAHPELKALGAQMIADQSREVEQMQGWLQAWYGQDVTCPMTPGQSGQRPGPGPMRPGGMMPGLVMPMMGGLWSLPPDQLDATLLTWMIEHHQGAIEMAALAEERAAHHEAKDLATNIMTTQSTEIETMRGWLAEWYGR
jgi:uncharacterized protein (DUF305 family)